MVPSLTIICGDALGELRKLPNESVQCCVTSPPYWGLRDYGTAEWEGGDEECDHKKPFDHVSLRTSTLNLAKDRTNDQSGTGHKHEGYKHTCGKCGAKRIDSQLGLEKTPEEYVGKMVEVFREVRRVLRKDGTLWINLGDSYWNGGGEKRDGGHGFIDGGKRKLDAAKGSLLQAKSSTELDLKPKDLIGIPWRVAFGLQADGWYLRSDIIWAKPNPMPESVTDRPTKAHEYLFLMSKSARYYYDAQAIKEEAEYRDDARPFGEAGNNRHGDEGSVYDPRASWKGSQFHLGKTAEHQLGRSSKKRGEFNGKTNALAGHEAFRAFKMTRNKRSVWTVATAPYPEAHFATYPPDLIKPCILAGTKCGDVVLDPFAGSGTTGEVSLTLGRSVILIELNRNYIPLIDDRCRITPGLALA